MPQAKTVNGVDGKKLLQFMESLAANKRKMDDLRQDRKEVFEAAAGAGFDKKAMRRLAKWMEMDEDERKEADLLDATYQLATGHEQHTLDLQGGSSNKGGSKRARAEGIAKDGGQEAAKGADVIPIGNA